MSSTLFDKIVYCKFVLALDGLAYCTECGTQLRKELVPSDLSSISCICDSINQQHILDHLAAGTHPNANQTSPTYSGPCQHLGHETRKQECPTCGGRIQIKVYACSLHNECTIQSRLLQVRACHQCEDYIPLNPVSIPSSPSAPISPEPTRNQVPSDYPSFSPRENPVQPTLILKEPLASKVNGNGHARPIAYRNPDLVPYRLPRKRIWNGKEPVNPNQPHHPLPEEFKQLLKQALSKPKSLTSSRIIFRSKGIVICAGGAKFFKCAWSCVHVLRSLGCTLPIEFWYLGSYELDPQMKSAAESLGIVLIDASEVAASLPLSQRPRMLNGWELKPFSIIHSRFEGVLLLDADNIPVKDPTYLFDVPQYKQLGSVFWSDLDPCGQVDPRNEWLPEWVWKEFDLTYRSEPDFESGQILVNKSKCWRELQITMLINEWSDFTYKIIFGDKSSYHLAWRLCGSDYALIPSRPGWKFPVILQYDFNGQLVFQHACRGKDQICSSSGLNHIQHHQLVYDSAQTLKKFWQGEIWSFQDQTPEETRYALANVPGVYTYERLGLGSREMTFSSDGRIKSGSAACEVRWSLRFFPEKTGNAHFPSILTPKLVIIGQAHKGSEIAMMMLTQDPINPLNWLGTWNQYEKCQIKLTRTLSESGIGLTVSKVG